MMFHCVRVCVCVCVCIYICVYGWERECNLHTHTWSEYNKWNIHPRVFISARLPHYCVCRLVEVSLALFGVSVTMEVTDACERRALDWNVGCWDFPSALRSSLHACVCVCLCVCDTTSTWVCVCVCVGSWAHGWAREGEWDGGMGRVMTVPEN